MARLRRSRRADGGIERRRRGRGFSYYWDGGAPVSDPAVLARIDALAIPPAWHDVWICAWANGHIQAMGTDAAGRRQYRYHDAWREHRDREKFDRVLSLGRSIESFRAQVAADLGGDRMDRGRVLAAAVRLLDLGCFRIGGEQYAVEHETYGIATLRKEHVRIERGAMIFSYAAKGSRWREVGVRDADVLPVVTTLRRRRSGGADLLVYKEGRHWLDVRSDDVNAYIKDVAGGDCSAKDLRTWSATVLAAARLAGVPAPSSRSARRRAEAAVVREVAEHLGNTPAVCRASYIDPRVLDRFEHAETIAPALARVHDPSSLDDQRLRNAVDQAVVELLDDEVFERRAA